jgi:4-hydroxy-3-polyprenylbenzoate decarboxylase
MRMKRLVVGVTGASGSVCARATLRALIAHPEVERIHVVLSAVAPQTISVELGQPAKDEREGLRALIGGGRDAKVVLHRPGDMAAPISSGTYPVDGMVVVPCSGGTLASIAHGVSANLIHRAAEVTLKERRPLVLAFRETPVSLVHLENMAAATRAGAVVFPLIPSFYTRPTTIDEIVNQFTARILDLLRLDHAIGKRWGTK